MGLNYSLEYQQMFSISWLPYAEACKLSIPLVCVPYVIVSSCNLIMLALEWNCQKGPSGECCDIGGGGEGLLFSQNKWEFLLCIQSTISRIDISFVPNSVSRVGM